MLLILLNKKVTATFFSILRRTYVCGNMYRSKSQSLTFCLSTAAKYFVLHNFPPLGKGGSLRWEREMEAVSWRFLSRTPAWLFLALFSFFFSGSSCDEDRRGGPHQRVAEQNPGERQSIRRKASGRAEGKHGSHGAKLRGHWCTFSCKSIDRKVLWLMSFQCSVTLTWGLGCLFSFWTGWKRGSLEFNSITLFCYTAKKNNIYIS